MTLKRAKNNISRSLTLHRLFNDFSHNQFYNDCSRVGSYKNITTETTSTTLAKKKKKGREEKHDETDSCSMHN